jgi:CheY-like chemotaxis protein
MFVIDNDFDAREMLGDLLEQQGYRVLQAANGRQAFEQLQTGAFAIQLFLLDLDMPIMNGWEFLDRFALQTRRFVAKIILVTGQEQKPIAGESAVLRKPLDVPQLLKLRAAAGYAWNEGKALRLVATEPLCKLPEFATQAEWLDSAIPALAFKLLESRAGYVLFGISAKVRTQRT